MIKALDYSTIDDIINNGENLTEEMKTKIFLNLVGAEENSCLESEDDTVKILKDKYGININKKKLLKILDFWLENAIYSYSRLVKRKIKSTNRL